MVRFHQNSVQHICLQTFCVKLIERAHWYRIYLLCPPAKQCVTFVSVQCSTLVHEHVYQAKFLLTSVLNMDGQENVVICAAACVLICSLLKKKRRRKPRCWVRPFLQRRNEEMNRFVEEIKVDPLSGFKNFTRISCEDFELLVNALSPHIAKQDTNYRKCVPVSIRLAITLRYLATGDSFASLMYLFKVSKELIARIVPETCKGLISVLKENIKVRKLNHIY
ncbi:unnamed protein product [Acanthoscelides obtectus]|uniref:Uncharacterized protein n=1 Tax=Acanthoscelides obtectus TaxID=200917 RepID=A0A9P0LIH0_ACAOB|nr:unnamed protein product [Acanthoscelides obtectus]CAK1664164.1 hypothetical protein AOBTE_LOCUS24093 [Acanthoscelides obtectus]